MQLLSPTQIKNLKTLLLSSEPNNWEVAIKILEGFREEYHFGTKFLSFLEGLTLYKYTRAQDAEIMQLRESLNQLLQEVNPSFHQQIQRLNQTIHQVSIQYLHQPSIAYPSILEQLQNSSLDLDNFGEALAAQPLYFASYNWRVRFLLDHQYLTQQQFEQAFTRHYNKSKHKIFLNISSFDSPTISSSYLKQLSSIEHIKIYENRFEQLPKAFYNYPLKSLTIYENPLKTIAPSCQNWKTLEKLELHKCRELESLPNELGLLPNIKTVELSHCRLNQFPQFILQLQNLESLTLSQNKLQDIPKEITQLKKLKKLSLHQNLPLHKIPSAIFEMTWLKDLRLIECNIKEIPEEIAQLQNLESLSISYNQIKKLPNSFKQLKKLKRLKLSGNPLFFSYVFDQILELPHVRQVEFLNIYTIDKNTYEKYYPLLSKRGIYVDVNKKNLVL
ncbi:MAG: hypothetical protein GY810_19615 [Aureispira sp.]|nr:hypothetical protein [Aureispira sp.]